MPVYTVHEPPRRDDDALGHAMRFRFVRDGFHFWAFLLPRSGCCGTGSGSS